MAFDKDAIIASLKEASILDLADLVKAIEDEFGVSAAAPVAAAGAAGDDAAAKDSFDVELTEPGQAKIGVIKAVRDATGLGLKESKDLVDGAPSVIKKDLNESDANDLKSKLEAAGATVALK
ncbi:50S ribosomal protein L7/L12 [Oenococcus oeni]|uniref:Large ribosomal subunit protein bL12 n=1 Tax=Oenococcus oeni (strain ATCC BAA-331 / PSU-1) TaxID=203123 RepID=RL7_OENOB|nr:50S ribosomal protein L7/L12 [Oenococcus oeni]Q04E45.1 RecName: Full=Large ribosomal subunit protein bL12; AltName: Full=50S ribosomal protein L7/L12 [Oenococcus oeni PSU-1]ABJ57277.1 LSU ribosomal protein L12P [Oenococcus oeni PSU-1]KGH82437.1 50S ribosomal protein L7/L12 [Oenococcus oeni S14]KZD14536.1 LSU ribosomal protein L7/L12 [Oenococcus oeni]OIK67640.1 50S ribosomal protein L7/L12 [Oenococcus oeni]OIL13787.1 50S ribosomal protein L7/L12 [Oenococcus oeni]